MKKILCIFFEVVIKPLGIIPFMSWVLITGLFYDLVRIGKVKKKKEIKSP